ncbi:universal stress protein [Mycetocola miduiensis]|uniref:Nucleotide-binding universal stress protein, UspA family n=1 Tax=Mycetocola miduiensis TaxID=995034 RepID=A0A1I4YNZ2_9MICO|nr:universal stress protein [Mycetocola miduiensis]SFN39320.1 Nucleotide-binding universal stress protein, UspA family [Mycetocola miduiensis]
MATRMLVGVKNVDTGRMAVRWAAERASSRGLGLHLVHIVDEGMRRAGSTGLLDAARSDVDQMLASAVELARSVAPELDVTTETRVGDPQADLITLSQDADMVVVGSDSTSKDTSRRHGNRGFRIAAASTTPVAVIPAIDVAGREGVVAGVDGSRISDRALVFAAEEADRLGQPLIAVNAWPNPVVYGYDLAFPVEYVEDLTEIGNQTLDRALDNVMGAHPNVPVHRIVTEGDPITVLSEVAEDASLIVVGSHGRGAVARFLLGSVSHGILARLSGPTVVVR